MAVDLRPKQLPILTNSFSFQNSNPGTKVFQVEAYDPDDPDTANGKLVYSLPDDGTIIKRLFQIDSSTGVLSTKVTQSHLQPSRGFVAPNT